MKENRTELFVGFFLLIGLLLLGFLVLKFGNFGDRFEEKTINSNKTGEWKFPATNAAAPLNII